MTTNTGTLVIAPLRPYDSADTYPTHEDVYGKGGFVCVSNTAERDAIPIERRKTGMVVMVEDSGSGSPQAYRLTSNNSFEVFDIAASEASVSAEEAAASAAAAADSKDAALVSELAAVVSASSAAASATQAGISATQAANSAVQADTAASTALAAVLYTPNRADVRVAATVALPANTYSSGVITITATGVLTVDTVTIALNDDVLVAAEIDATKNGVYRCTTAGATGVSAVLTRRPDSDTGAELVGACFRVLAGTANAEGRFRVDQTNITLGTTPVTFSRMPGSVAAEAARAISAESALQAKLDPIALRFPLSTNEPDLSGWHYGVWDGDGRELALLTVYGEWAHKVPAAFPRLRSDTDVIADRDLIARKRVLTAELGIGAGISTSEWGESDLTGWERALIDADGRVLVEFGTDGVVRDYMPHDWRGPAITSPPPMPQYAHASSLSSSHAVYTMPTGSRDIDVYAEHLATGTVTKLSAGGRNTRPSLTSDSTRVIWTRESDGAIVTAPIAGGTIVNAFSDRRIVMRGDSMTSGFGASDWSTTSAHAVPQSLQVLLGKRVVNRGTNSLTARQIAAHAGSIAPTISVEGGMIPASGAVNVTLTPNDLLSQYVNIGLYGTINGVAGSIYRTTTGGQAVFTRSAAGSAVAVADGTPLIASVNANELYTDKVPSDANLNEWITIIWAGYNSKLDPTGNRAAVSAIVENLRAWKTKYLVLSVIPGNNERNTSGDNKAGYDGIVATNTFYSADWGDRYVDLIGPLQSANNGSAGDLQDLAWGIIPRSLRADDAHPNDAGYTVVRDVIAAKLTALGWHY